MAYIVGRRNHLAPGTILAGGTLSAEFDLSDITALGLMTDSNLINGTLSFQVSPYSDNESNANNTPFYRDVLDESGSVAQIGPVSGAIAIKTNQIVQILSGYRYIKVKMSIAQTNGVKLYIAG